MASIRRVWISSFYLFLIHLVLSFSKSLIRVILSEEMTYPMLSMNFPNRSYLIMLGKILKHSAKEQ